MPIFNRLVFGLALGAVLFGSAAANAESFQVLYSFKGTPDGRFPSSGVVFDSAGNLYGTTAYNGSSNACGSAGCGALFKLTPPAKGHTAWTETLYSFNGTDGANPSVGAWLTLRNGVFYGTASYGGYSNSTSCQGGCGTVFAFNPANGLITVLYAFPGGSGAADVGGPFSGVVFDTSDNLYGTIEGGNDANYDALFKLTPPPKGNAWQFAILYAFGFPAAVWVFDKSGDLYGAAGGSGNTGTIFKFDIANNKLTTLYTFSGGADGGGPGWLTIQYATNGTFVLYGTTKASSDKTNAGTVFEFDPATGKLTTLYAFTGGADGYGPTSPPLFDARGALYGTAGGGGNAKDCVSFGYGGCGVVYKLTPPAKGKTSWTESVLHSFTGGADGAAPYGPLAFDAQGALYGATIFGGDNTACPDNNGYRNSPPNPPPGCGVVFKLTP